MEDKDQSTESRPDSEEAFEPSPHDMALEAEQIEKVRQAWVRSLKPLLDTSPDAMASEQHKHAWHLMQQRACERIIRIVESDLPPDQRSSDL